METESVLGHLAFNFAKSPENLATEALAYILQKSPTAQRALHEILRNDLNLEIPHNLIFSTQVADESQSIPDLIGKSGDDEVLIVEAKFWAGLTDNQPVTYARRILKTPSAILLFITPSVRIDYLWPVLQNRCKAEHIHLDDRPGSGAIKISKIGEHHALAICSWTFLLEHIQRKLLLENEMAIAQDVTQLLGLCKRMDTEAFVPLMSEDLNPTIGSRILQFLELINSVVDELTKTGGIATRQSGLVSWGGGYYRCFRIGGYGFSLELLWEAWAKKGYTPLWLSVRDGEFKATQEVKDAFASLLTEDLSRAKLIKRGKIEDVLVPLTLLTGVEKEALRDSLVAQIVEVAKIPMNRTSTGFGDTVQHLGMGQTIPK